MNKTALVLATVATLGLSSAAFANTAPATKEHVRTAHAQTVATHKHGHFVRAYWAAGHWFRGHWFARHLVHGHWTA
jgi:hypothetical protein